MKNIYFFNYCTIYYIETREKHISHHPVANSNEVYAMGQKSGGNAQIEFEPIQNKPR